jgi:hypothetical protein
MLPGRYRYAFEFRHRSWYEHAILDVLRDHDASLCLSDHHQAPAPWQVTAGHVYVRGHGPGGRYKENYPDKTLRLWAQRIRRWCDQGMLVFVYFDNDQKSAAPADAHRLATLLPPSSKGADACPARHSVEIAPKLTFHADHSLMLKRNSPLHCLWRRRRCFGAGGVRQARASNLSDGFPIVMNS